MRRMLAKDRIYKIYDDHRNFYLPNHQFMLMKIQKVASTSLWISMHALMGRIIENRTQLFENRIPHLPSHQVHKFPEVFKAGFVRNPWDRLLGCYLQKKAFNRKKFYKRNKIDPTISFSDFVKTVCAVPEWKADTHFRSQFTFVSNIEGDLLINFIGRFEYLNEDFQEMLRLANLPKIELPHWNSNAHDNYTQYYTPGLAELVADRYAIDIELFGYEFGKPLSPGARFRWRDGTPNRLKMKIAQYKSDKLMNSIRELSMLVSPYK